MIKEKGTAVKKANKCLTKIKFFKKKCKKQNLKEF